MGRFALPMSSHIGPRWILSASHRYERDSGQGTVVSYGQSSTRAILPRAPNSGGLHGPDTRKDGSRNMSPYLVLTCPTWAYRHDSVFPNNKAHNNLNIESSTTCHDRKSTRPRTQRIPVPPHDVDALVARARTLSKLGVTDLRAWYVDFPKRIRNNRPPRNAQGSRHGRLR